MGESIKYVVDGDASRALRENAKLIKSQDKVIRQLRDQVKGSKTAEKADSSRLASGAAGAGKMALQIAGIGSAMGGVALLIGQIRREMANLREAQRRAAEAQIDEVQARYTALQQAPTRIPQQELIGMVGRVSEASNVTQGVLWHNLPATYSALGSGSAKDLEAAVQVGALKHHRSGGAINMGELASALLSLQKAIGLGEGQSGDQTMGALQQFGSAALIGSTADQAKALTKVLRAARGLGVGIEPATELLAVFTHLTADAEGRRSSTGVVNLMKTLQTKAVIPTGPNTWRMAQGDTLAEKFTDVQGFFASSSETGQNAFIKNFGAEAGMIGPLLQLFRRDPKALAELASAQKAIGAADDPALASLATDFESQAWTGTGAAIVDAKARIKRSADDARLREPRAIISVFREEMKGLLQAHGFSALAQDFAKAKFEIKTLMGETPFDAFERVSDAAVGNRVEPYIIDDSRERREWPYYYQKPNPNYDPVLRREMANMKRDMAAIEERFYSTAPDRDTRLINVLERLDAKLGDGIETRTEDRATPEPAAR
jgi:hypothetical protein